MVVNLALAVLAGVGLDTLVKKRLSRTYLLTLGGLSLLVLLGQGALWLFRAELLAWAGAAEGQAARLLTYHLDYAFNLDPVYQERLWLRQLPYVTVPAVLAMLNAAIALVHGGINRSVVRPPSIPPISGGSLEPPLKSGDAKREGVSVELLTPLCTSHSPSQKAR
jgi:hypothetical protein